MSDILIIDDDSGFAASVAELARAEGFVPRLAGSIAEGREQLRHGSDVLLLDIHLPDGSGFDLLPEIDPARHGRVAIVTGHPSVETAARAVSGPVSDYLVKPFDPVSFVSLLRESRRVPRYRGGSRVEPIPGVVAASNAMGADPPGTRIGCHRSVDPADRRSRDRQGSVRQRDPCDEWSRRRIRTSGLRVDAA